MIKVSYSKASCYLTCPYLHYLRYVERLRPKKPERPLTFGKDFHKLLQFRTDKEQRRAAFKDIKQQFYDLPPKFQSELGDNYVGDLKTIFNDYRKVWKGTERPVVTEREFLIQIAKYQGEPIYFHGIIDEEYEDLILGEHKTFGTMPKMDILAMNMQTNLYSKAKELETGKKFKRVQWDYIRSKPATYPIWLPKSNKFSRAQNGNITPYSWERACAEKEITDEAILAQGAIFKPNIASFYFRCYTELLPGMVDSCWDNFKLLIHELIVHGDTNKMKNISRNCSWCSMRPICYAEFTGADVKYIRKTDYTIKEIEEDVKEPNEGTD